MVNFGENVKAVQISCGFNHTGAVLEYNWLQTKHMSQFCYKFNFRMCNQAGDEPNKSSIQLQIEIIQNKG